MKATFLPCVLLMLSLGMLQAQSPLDLDAYGVWDRGSVSNKKYKDPNTADYQYLKGVRANFLWSQVQPKGPGRFDWSLFQEAIDWCHAKDQYLFVSITVGPDAPEWIYAQGTPRVFLVSPSKWPHYPYYDSAAYKKYWYELIDAFGVFIRSQPQEKLAHIQFIQVMDGCTGDDDPYKGQPKNTVYDMDSTWTSFKKAGYERYKKAFNDGNPETAVPLAFNGIYPGSELWDWAVQNMAPTLGFGTKGSAYVRGHHLTDEANFRNDWGPYLIQPQGTAVFSFAEMDQTFKKDWYQINVPLGLYWGMLSGLNTGLGVWNVAQEVLEYAAGNTEVQDMFRFFNRHAPNIFPQTATAAYSIFHAGLNAENTEKFPESTYGKASKNNQARYLAICAGYQKYGAKMDDLQAATQGQVAQRDGQKGFNDAGWGIQEGNYERWLEQIDPEGTSIPLWRVQGKIHAQSSPYDRFARSFESTSGKNTLYFKFDPQVFNQTPAKNLTFRLVWLDKTAGSSWDFRYLSTSGPRIAASVHGKGDKLWKELTISISDAVLGGQGERGSDFTLVNTDTVDDIFHGMEVAIDRGFVSILTP